MTTESDLMVQFDEMLDEVYDPFEMGGMTFLPSQILKSDSGAYRESFLNWCSANDYDF